MASDLARTHNKDWIELAWLIKLRWYSSALQLSVLLLAEFSLELTIPFYTLLAVVALSFLSNCLALSLANANKLDKFRISSAILFFDSLVLTTLLCFSGGNTNPLSILYIVHVALAAVMLGASWMWFFVVLNSLSFFLLAIYYWPVAELEMHHHHAPQHGVNLHLHGMIFSFALTAALLGFILAKITRSVALHQEELVRLKNQQTSREHLARLTTLAAGAAHELRTPISTISLVAHEMLRKDHSIAVREDLELIQNSVVRCQNILSRLGQKTGGCEGEMPTTIRCGEIVELLLSELPSQLHKHLEFSIATEAASEDLNIPVRAVLSAIGNLINNAIDASNKSQNFKVRISFLIESEYLKILVIDSGLGFSQQIKERLGEPFFTTKKEGAGLGLGVFLARTLAQDLGGKLEFESLPEQGTKVSMYLKKNLSC